MGLINALIKTVTLPVEVVKDVVEVVSDGEVAHTEEAVKDIFDEITEGV